MPELNCKIDGCGYSGSPQGLRSHIHGKKGDDEHREAAENRDHHDWYPVAYGLDEESTDDEGDDEGDDTPTETPSEGADPAPSEGGSDGEGADTLDPAPSEGGAESPDEADEYEAQWEGADTPSDGGESAPSEEGTNGEGEDTPADTPSDPSDEGGSGGLGTALVLGTGALAVAVLLRGRGSDPTESPDATTDADTQNEDLKGASGWGKSEDAVPLEGTDADDMEFTPTET